MSDGDQVATEMRLGVQNMAMVAIITARGGSKRIPRKNVKAFMGRPMIAYAIAAAKESGLLDEVMVSTDDAEIAEIAKANGAAVPFLRSAATANDFATTNDVLTEVLAEYAKLGRTFDAFCCIYPCVPFLTGELLRVAGETFAASGARGLVPVVRYSYPIQRALVRDSAGFISFREPENAAKRSQDLQPTFHDAGMFYFATAAAFAERGGIPTDSLAMFELPEARVQDIDTEEDWKMAEMKYRMMEEEGIGG